MLYRIKYRTSLFIIFIILSKGLFCQSKFDFWIGTGLNLNSKIEIYQNPFKNDDHLDKLKSKPTISGVLIGGVSVNHENKFKSHLNLSHGRLPYKLKYDYIYPEDNSSYPSVPRDNVIRLWNFSYLLEWNPFKSERENLKKIGFNVGIGVTFMPTFESFFNETFILDTARVLVYEHVVVEGLMLKPESSSSIYRYYVNYHFGLTYNLEKLNSKIFLGIIRSPTPVAFGGFQFVNQPYSSEGYLSLRNNAMNFKYQYNLSSLKNKKKDNQ